ARVAVRNQPVQAGGAVLGASEESMLDRVEHQVGGHRPSSPPAQDPAAVGVDDECDVDEPRPGRHIGKVGYPQPIWSRRVEPSVDEIGVTHVTVVGDGGLVLGSAACAFPTVFAHDPFHCAAATSWPWPRSQIHNLRDPNVWTNRPFFLSSLAAVMISTSSAS